MATVHHRIPNVISQNCATLADADRLCLICMMLVRGEQITRLEAETKRLMADGSDRVVWLESQATRDVFEAVATGYSDIAPQLGLVRVCWEHFAGIQMQEQSQLAVANAPLPPGFANGSHRKGRG